MLHDMVTPRLRGHSARLAEWETLARLSITSRTERAVVQDIGQPPVTPTISPPEFASANLTVRAFPCSMGGKITALDEAASLTGVEQGASIVPAQAGGASLTTIEQQMNVTTGGKR